MKTVEECLDWLRRQPAGEERDTLLDVVQTLEASAHALYTLNLAMPDPLRRKAAALDHPDFFSNQ